VWVLAPIVWHGLRAEADAAAAALVVTPETTGPLVELLGVMRDLVARAQDAAPPVRYWVTSYLDLCEAEATRAAGDSSPDAWAKAAASWRERHQPYPSAYARMREAEARLAKRSGRPEAAQALAEAAEVARAMGARPFLAEIEALAARARITLARDRAVSAGVVMAVGSGPGPAAASASAESPPNEIALAALGTLTRREQAVLEEMAEGRSNKEIAGRLFISEKTVSVHVTHILSKLGLRSRSQASALLHRARQIAAPSGG
jgi:DNA-binding CsgD family transcriptional regulator